MWLRRIFTPVLTTWQSAKAYAENKREEGREWSAKVNKKFPLPSTHTYSPTKTKHTKT